MSEFVSGARFSETRTRIALHLTIYQPRKAGEDNYAGLLNGQGGIVYGRPNELRGGSSWPTIENMFPKWNSGSSFAQVS